MEGQITLRATYIQESCLSRTNRLAFQTKAVQEVEVTLQDQHFKILKSWRVRKVLITILYMTIVQQNLLNSWEENPKLKLLPNVNSINSGCQATFIQCRTFQLKIASVTSKVSTKQSQLTFGFLNPKIIHFTHLISKWWIKPP